MTNTPAEHPASVPQRPAAAQAPGISNSIGRIIDGLRVGTIGFFKYAIGWPIVQTLKLTRNTIKGAVEGVITGTFGTVGGAFKGAGKQIGETAHGIQEAINESRKEWDKAENIAKLAAPINALIEVTTKLAMGALQLPVSLIEGAVEKPPEGASKVLAGIKPWDLDRKGESNAGTHAAEAHARSHGGGHG